MDAIWMADPSDLPPNAPGALVATVQPRGRGELVREMFLGADEAAPDRPGRHLEIPQRLGILPTLAFWNRRDVWPHARWFIAPVAASAALLTGLGAAVVGPVLAPLVGLATGVPVVLTAGLLERWVRGRRGRLLP